MIDQLPINRALISVYDKTGLSELVEVLRQFNVEIYSSGGTFDFLSQRFSGIRSLSEITGVTSLLDGRVKTLHPYVHAAILAKKDSQEHLEELRTFDVEPFDLVVVNFYPFEKVLEKENISEDEIIENIDIGGPALVRSAAKNFNSVAVISSIEQYDLLIEELKKYSGSISLELRKKTCSRSISKNCSV